MPPSPSASASPELRAALTAGLDQPAHADAADMSAFLARAFGPTSVAVVHYGSRAQGRQTRADSAFDFFMVVDSYRDGYESLAATVGTSYSPGVATALARVLAPNVIAVTERDTERRAKVVVISLRDLQRACSPHPRDHFTQGRLLQFVLLTWSRDAQAAAAIHEAVASARARTFIWGRPSLPARFTVDDYAYAVLKRSLAGEIRPESGDHARTLVAAQQETLRAIYAPLLTDLAARGALVPDGAGPAYRLAVPAGRLESLRLSLYFQKSKIRNTIRLLKHVVLYEGWLEYIIRKIDRSSGERIELTDRERRWPLIFLWPRFFHYLRTRPQRRQ
jgi:hypothetical protein